MPAAERDRRAGAAPDRAHGDPAARVPRASGHDRQVARRLGALLLATALLAGCGRTPDPLAECRLPANGTVLAIGDSITRGFGADGNGYAEQLQALLAADPARAGIAVVNRGLDGERSAGLLARLDDELAEHEPAVVLITSGGNDFLRRVPEADTRRQLAEAVERVRARGAFPIVFGIPRPSLAAAVGRVDEHPLYEDLAEAGRAHVIRDTVAEVLSDESLKSDTIHPNAAGYARMARAAAEALGRCR